MIWWSVFSHRFVVHINASVDECGGYLEGASGILQSPAYPSGYPHRHRCQ